MSVLLSNYCVNIVDMVDSKYYVRNRDNQP